MRRLRQSYRWLRNDWRGGMVQCLAFFLLFALYQQWTVALFFVVAALIALYLRYDEVKISRHLEGLEREQRLRRIMRRQK